MTTTPSTEPRETMIARLEAVTRRYGVTVAPGVWLDDIDAIQEEARAAGRAEAVREGHSCSEHWPTPADFDKFTDEQFLAYTEAIGFGDSIRAALAEVRESKPEAGVEG